jgi:hypothetical protein
MENTCSTALETWQVEDDCDDVSARKDLMNIMFPFRFRNQMAGKIPSTELEVADS